MGDLAAAGIVEAVLDGADPDVQTASLLVVTQAATLLPMLFPERDKKADARRGAETEWHGDAAAKAIAEINTVMMSAIIVPIVVTGGS